METARLDVRAAFADDNPARRVAEGRAVQTALTWMARASATPAPTTRPNICTNRIRSFQPSRVQGVVTLTGRVTMPYKADALVELASRVIGVQEVQNQIGTLPVSMMDDQLRYTIARRIYGDPLFWNYAIQVSPPIHIVVENGRVTLTGVVQSEVERRKAEVVARSTFGVFSVENTLRLEHEPS